MRLTWSSLVAVSALSVTAAAVAAPVTVAVPVPANRPVVVASPIVVAAPASHTTHVVTHTPSTVPAVVEHQRTVTTERVTHEHNGKRYHVVKATKTVMHHPKQHVAMHHVGSKHAGRHTGRVMTNAAPEVAAPATSLEELSHVKVVEDRTVTALPAGTDGLGSMSATPVNTQMSQSTQTDMTTTAPEHNSRPHTGRRMHHTTSHMDNNGTNHMNQNGTTGGQRTVDTPRDTSTSVDPAITPSSTKP